MHNDRAVIAAAACLMLAVAPALLAVFGSRAARRGGQSAAAPPPWDRKLSVASALLYALAFNVVFFMQEFFLALAKALTPGLKPTLFHNNHTWTGDSPLIGLLQGSGALAIFTIGSLCALLLWRYPPRSVALRLFLIWMTYNGFLQALPQVIFGAAEPRNDVGMALEFLQLSEAAKALCAFAALLAVVIVALKLRAPFLRLAARTDDIATATARARFLFRVATLPAFAAVLLIVPFRVPRNWIEALAVPVVVAAVGTAWIQAGGWSSAPAIAGDTLSTKSVMQAFAALLILLLAFHLLLRPGVRFY